MAFGELVRIVALRWTLFHAHARSLITVFGSCISSSFHLTNPSLRWAMFYADIGIWWLVREFTVLSIAHRSIHFAVALLYLPVFLWCSQTSGLSPVVPYVIAHLCAWLAHGFLWHFNSLGGLKNRQWCLYLAESVFVLDHRPG